MSRSRWYAVILPVLLSAAVGLGVAVHFTARFERSLLLDQWESRNSWQFDFQNDAAMRLAIIELAQKGDTETIIRTNCMLLRSGIRGISANAFPPQRRVEVQAFLDQARATVADLEREGHCMPLPAKSPSSPH